MNDNTHGEFAELLGISVVSRGREAVRIDMDAEGKRQPYGILHGGANAVLVEHAASLLGAEICPQGTVPVGTRVSAEHLRPVRRGRLAATARVRSLSATGATIDVDIVDEAGRTTARGEQILVFLPSGRLR